MYRFLLRPRWIVGHLLVIVTVVAFVNLGLWQLRRLDDRQARNALITARLGEPVQPFDTVLTETGGDPEQAQFRRVEITGTFAAPQLLTAPRSLEGQPGHQVLGVLETRSGPAMLVDRGWIAFDRSARPPAAPDGPVRISGVLRAAEPGAPTSSEQVAHIAPDTVADRLGRALAPVYVQAVEQQAVGGQQSPQVAALPPTPLPRLTEGNHRSYAGQWFIFAAIVLIGYPLLVWRTAHRARELRGGRHTSTMDRPLSTTSTS